MMCSSRVEELPVKTYAAKVRHVPAHVAEGRKPTNVESVHEPVHEQTEYGEHEQPPERIVHSLQRKIGNRGVVQMIERSTSRGKTSDIHSIATAGVRGGGATFPFLNKIQALFGKHDLSGVRAYSGGHASRASRAIHAEAYTIGNKVAFGKTPTLHTAAHEAAHVIQQRAGVSLKGGIGQVGDRYEQHADRVADAVVAGRSAEAILSHAPRGGSSASSMQPKVQRKMGMEFQTVSKKGPTILAIYAKGKWKVAEKGHGTLISKQNKWKLEKDEKDLEYITDAIDERTAPETALSSIMEDMYTQTQSWIANKSFVVSDELALELGITKSDFTTFVALNRRDSGLDLELGKDEEAPTYLIGFPEGADVYGSPQVTMGVRLTKLAQFFEDMVPDKLGILSQEEQSPLGGEFGVKPSDRRTKQFAKMQTVLTKVRTDLNKYNTESEPALTDKLKGVLTFALAQLGSVMGHDGGSLFKDTTAIMHRTSFIGMAKTFKKKEKESYVWFLTDDASPIVTGLKSLYFKGLGYEINRKYFGKLTIGQYLTQLSEGKDPWVVKQPATKQVAGLHNISELDRRKYGITRETDIGHDSGSTKKSGAILEIRSLPRTTLSKLPALAASLQAYLKKLHE